MNIVSVTGSALMLVGILLSLIAVWGLLDFPSALARMHAATKSASLGLALVAIGSGMATESFALAMIGVLVAAFMFLTAPISGHMLGRAAYGAGQAPGLVHDDLAGAAASPEVARSDSGSGISAWRMVPLVLVWVALWRDASPGVWIGGAAVALVIELLRRERPEPGRIRPGALVSFAARYVGMVFTSNARVAWEVITPRNDRIREAIVAVPLRSNSRRVAILVANAISYTPGSLTIDLTEAPLVLYVHVLHFESSDAVRDEVGRLEDLVMKALGEPVPA